MNPTALPFYTSSKAGENYSVFHETNGKVVRSLVPEGANMYALDIFDYSPVDYGLQTKHIEVLKAFIDCGANRDAIIEKASDDIKADLLAHYKVY